MRRGILIFLAVLISAYGRKHTSAQIPEDQKILHALNRLTFGPRPGDVERVGRMGLKKWMDQQLHPGRIRENPVLEAKLGPLDTLRMSTAEILANYPTPTLIQLMAGGRLPLPADPEKRARMERLLRRYQRSDKPTLQTIGLTDDQQRLLRAGAPEEKLILFDSLPEDRQYDLLEILPRRARLQLYAVAPAEMRRKLREVAGPRQVIAQDLTQGKLFRAIHGNRQLEEVLTDFWYNHFNVFLDKGVDHFLVTSHERDVIRPRVLGRFRDLLLATAQSPAMLYYLDNVESVAAGAGGRRARRGLNENYARELMELHTLGVDGGYTQRDVTEVARCFTGWTIHVPRDGGGFFFNEKVHDQGEKIVLGVRIPAGGGMEDGLKVIEILARAPATARFISKALATRFVSDDPPPSLVEKMARTFRARKGDLREVMKTMLGAPEFWSQAAWRAKMKSPLEMVASSIRALDGEVQFGFALAEQLKELGQPLYRKQEPTGYTNSSREWINSAGLLARMNFALSLANNRLPGVRVDLSRFGNGADPMQIARDLLMVDLSAPARAAIEKEQDRSPGMIAGLTLGSPDFQRR